jgi:hypothetical protein
MTMAEIASTIEETQYVMSSESLQAAASLIIVSDCYGRNADEKYQRGDCITPQPQNTVNHLCFKETFGQSR